MASSCNQRHTVVSLMRGHDPAVLRFAHDVGATETRQRQPPRGGQFTSEGLNLHDQLWGEKPGAARAGALLEPW